MHPSTIDNIVNTPDILGAICDHCNRADLTRIICVSRPAFAAAAPRIWRSLNGAQHLLKLLSPVFKIQSGGFVLHFEEGSRDFTRFKIYAVYVQKLIVLKSWKIGETGNADFHISSWRFLVQQAKITPLLPNLEELEFAPSQKFGQDLLIWLSTFASPSLRKLSALTDDCFRGNPATLLVLLKLKCPNIASLSLGPVIRSLPL
ncbi:F-box protein [Ceratobasidium sp. AG-Ba]|nr:F-box protein [Ceratobasidium sp. AG-Ba]